MTFAHRCCAFLLLLLFTQIAHAEEPPTVSLTPQWKAEQFTGVDTLERAMVAQVNSERRTQGLAPLIPSIELQTAARQHCTEMVEKRYFEHESPQAEWRMPWQRTYYAGYWGFQVGENLAVFTADDTLTPAAVAARCVTLWMGSRAHRADLLEAKWTLTGVGVVRAGERIYVTQLFAGPLVILEHAELAPASGEFITLRLAGEVKSGLVNIFVNDAQVQSVLPIRGEYTTTLTYPRNSGVYEISVAMGCLEAWTAVLDTDKPGKKLLSVKRIARSGVVTNAATDIAPFTGLRLTGSVMSPAQQKVAIMHDGGVCRYLTPDSKGHAAFELLLSKRKELYTISFMVDQQSEELLFIDANGPLAQAFHCRPK